MLGVLRQLQVHVLLQQRGRTDREQVDHLEDLVAGQLVEDHDVVDTVEELGKCFFSSSSTLVFIRSYWPLVGGTGSGEAHAHSLGDVLVPSSR